MTDIAFATSSSSRPLSARAGRVFRPPAGLRRQHLDHLFAGQDSLDAGHDVLRLERLAVIFPDVTVCDDSGLGPQVPRELPALVVLDDDDAPALAESGANLFSVEGHQELDLQVIGGDPLLIQAFHSLPDHAP